MPSFLTNQTVGAGVAGDVQLAAHFNKFNISQSDAGREFVISATKTGGFRDDDLVAIYRQLTVIGADGDADRRNGPDAGTFAAIGTLNGTFQKDVTTGVYENAAGDTLTVLHFRLQTTGTPNLTTVDASTYRDADTNDITLAIVVVFAPAA